MLLLHDNKDQK